MVIKEDKFQSLSEAQKHKIMEFYHKKKNRNHVENVSAERNEYSRELASTQKRLWLLQQMNPDDVSYNMPFSVKLTGHINMSALKESFRILFRNNDSLRMSFPVENGSPTIHISDDCDPLINIIDAKNDQAVHELFNKEAAMKFDLEKGPLYKIILAKESDEVTYLLFVAHHIIFDGISSSIFINTLSQVYKGVVNEIRPYYVGKTTSYLEFSKSEKEWLKSDEAQVQRDFWSHKLSGELPVLDFPFVTNENSSSIGARSSIDISEDLSAKMNSFAGENGITVFTVLFAAYGLLLNKYTHMDDLIIGTPFAGRHDSSMYGIVGNFINTLPIRIGCESNTTTKEYLECVWKAFQDVYDNQRFPFDEIVNLTKANRNTDTSPIYQTLFVFQNYFKNNIELEGVKVEPGFVHNGSSKFDLSLSVGVEALGMKCVFEYDKSKIPEWMIANIKNHYINAIKYLISSPDKLLKDIQLLNDDELEEILYKWNDTFVDYKREKIIYRLFEEQVDCTPKSIALVYKDKTVTYEKLDKWANKIANHLIAKGVKTNDLVGIVMNRSLEMVAAIYGIIKAGAAYVPIDPEYPTDRISYMIDNAQMDFVLSQVEQDSLLQKVSRKNELEYIYMDAEEKVYENCLDTRPEIDVRDKDIVYMIYTSGSTGNPKGVMNTNEALANRVLWMQKEYDIKHGDKVLQKTPYCFDVSVWEFVWPLITGGTLVIAEPGGHRDASYLCKTIIDNSIDIIHFVPSMLNFFLLDDSVRKCISLKKVFCSGEALNYASVKKFKELLPDTQIHNLYGPTEAAIDVTYWECAKEYERNVIPIGKPIDNVYMYILDDNMNPVPKGVFGELYIGGIGLAKGYYNNDKLTNEKFVGNPFIDSEDERLYQTGDIGRFNVDGVIEYYKRKDFQVKLRGQRIELGEIEAALEKNEFIEQAAALVFEDSNGLQNLMSFLVLDKVTSIDENSLKENLGKCLPKYMIPSFFEVIDNMPLTPNGKVNRKELQSMIKNHSVKRDDAIPPRNDVEQKIFDICVELLGHNQVSITDNLMEIGAYSLLIASLVYKIRDVYKVDISFKYVYENPYIERIAKHILEADDETGDDVVDIREDVNEILKTPIISNISTNNKANVFITGATGFVGAYILNEFQGKFEKVYVLVREGSKDAGIEKLAGNLSKYKLSLNKSKVEVVLGDFSKDNLGISKDDYDMIASDVSLIVHNGALVNYSYPYKLLKEPNVASMNRIAKLAVEGNKKEIYFVSSLHVFSDKDAENTGVIEEYSIPQNYEDLKIGYSQSKWAAEQLLIERAKELDLNYKIFRLGRVGGASDTGALQSADFIMILLKLCMKLGAYPDIEMEINYVPVDYVAKFIAAIGDSDNSQNVFHVFNRKSYTSLEVFALLEKMGISLQKISIENWLSLLHEKTSQSDTNSEYMVVYDLIKDAGSEEQKRVYDSSNFEDGQKLIGIHCPEMNDELLQKYINWNKRGK